MGDVREQEWLWSASELSEEEHAPYSTVDIETCLGFPFGAVGEPERISTERRARAARFIGLTQSTARGRVRRDYEVEARFEDKGAFVRSIRFSFRACFLEALDVAGDLVGTYKREPYVRVALLEDGDGTDVLERGTGSVVHGAREVAVWRAGIPDMDWRPVPGRRATARRR